MSRVQRVVLRVSDDGVTKWIASVDSKTVRFGSCGSSDYTIHGDSERALRYLRRHKGLNLPSTATPTSMDRVVSSLSEHWDDASTRGFWSRWLLWSRPSLSSAISFMERRFHMKIKLYKLQPLVRGRPFPLNKELILASNFGRSTESVSSAMSSVERNLKAHREGRSIGFTKEASLKGMGLVSRSDGKYRITKTEFLQLLSCRNA